MQIVLETVCPLRHTINSLYVTLNSRIVHIESTAEDHNQNKQDRHEFTLFCIVVYYIIGFIVS